MDDQVIGLGAWCDVVTNDEADADGGDALRGRVSVRIAEFAVMTDGRRVTLHEARGFDVQLHELDRGDGLDAGFGLTLEQLERDVRTAVLPDDAEDTGEEHPWEWLAGLLRSRGAEVTPAELQRVPYEVVFSEALRSRFAPGA